MSDDLSIVVLIPVFNDWDSAHLLLLDLDRVLQSAKLMATVLLVDDSSTTPMPDSIRTPLSSIRRLDILELRRNLGHQRAIAVALAFVHASLPCDAVAVMDGDGEDKPSDILPLLKQFDRDQRSKIVFAERARRSEGLVFRAFYWLYRGLHCVLTGFGVRVGNFSVLPYRALDTLVVVSELWNHYAAAVFKSRLPYSTVPTTRGVRLSGRRHMQFTSLVVHGLSALSVYGDVIGVRILMLMAGLALALTCGILLTIGIRLTTHLAIPGWATFTIGILLVLIVQIAAVSVLFVFSLLASRASMSFIPLRDYAFFVKRVRPVFPDGH